MTNFFEQQRRSRSRSKKIIGLFFIFLVLQFVGTYFVYKDVLAPFIYSSSLGSYTNFILNGSIGFYDPSKPLHNHALIFSLIIAFFFLIVFFSRRLFFLSRPHKIPLDMGAKQIFPNSKDLKEQTYYNIVSEMSLASGVPMPKVYLLTQEKAINAFTSGHNFKTADITITQGALEHFTRDELQAVVAHEFGHIVSEDVKASVNLLSVIYSFSIIYTIGLYILRAMGRSSRRSSSRSKGSGGGQLILIAVAIVVIGYVGFLLSRVITAVFSREREYLADSLSVQFTRYPAGLASSLAKIRDHAFHSHMQHEKSQEIASICFSSPFRSFVSLFDSHPPIKNRISRLDKKFLEVGSSFVKEKEPIKEKGNKNHKTKDMNKTLEYMMGMGVLTEENKEPNLFLNS